MRKWLRLLLLIGFILAFGITLAYWWGTPRLSGFSPADGAIAVPAGSEIRLTFTHPMQEATLIEHISIEPSRRGSFSWQENTLIFTPDQPWEAGSTVHVELQPGGRTQGLLSFSLRQGAIWSFRVRQPGLVYLYPSSGPANIYLLNPLSGESQPLTNHPRGVESFSVNNTGSAIYYSANDNQGGSNIFRLNLINDQEESPSNEINSAALLDDPELILACPDAHCRSPVISPNGFNLAYERTALPGTAQASYPQIWVLTLYDESTPLEELPAPYLAGNPQHHTVQPQWSPENLLTYYDRDDAAFVILNIESGQQALFHNQTGEAGTWHPNGRDYIAAEINFLDETIADSVEGLQSFANSHLILFNRLDGTTQDLTPGEGMEDTTPTFSPDGFYLVFARKFIDFKQWTPGRQIWMARTSLLEAQQLSNDPDYNHFDFAWNPAGDQLAYVRFHQTTPTNPLEIWLMDPFSGRAVRLITGGYAPQWIP